MPDNPCPHCGQLNERQREVCWACFKLLKPQEAKPTGAPAAQLDIPGSIPAPPSEQSLPGLFGGARTTKTTITINGKEYDRLADVPERFRSLIKDSLARAGQGSRSRIVVNGTEYARLEDVPEPFRSKLKDGIARARPALPKPAAPLGPVSFSLDPPIQPLDFDPGSPAAPPDGFRFEDNGLERRISWRWSSLRVIGALLFVALWDGILWFTLYAAFSSKARLPDLAVPLILAAIGGGMAYAVAAYLVNRTTIRVDAARVSVRHGPLPWFGTRDVLKADIARVWSEKNGSESDEDTLLEPRVTYRVKLLLKSGKMLKAAGGLLDPDQAVFIEQQIRRA